jgi:diguanylate cyclase
MLSIVSDVIFGLLGFLGGVVVSYFGVRYWPSQDATPGPAAGQPPNDSAVNNAARMQMAVEQLRDLAQHVASDVGAHSSMIDSMSSELSAGEEVDGDATAIALDVIAKILTANEKLQDRLERAEQQIATQATEIQTQQSEARTDVLTGLANRRAFDDVLADNAQRFVRDGRPFSLILLDIDEFKRFNDVHGHLAGDEVLRAFGQTLTRNVKGSDFACRYGGEEFAVIMPGAAISDARAAGERLRKAVEATFVAYDGQSLNVTASFGVAECRRGERTDQLFRRADDCVYQSKQAGRNRGYWHTGEESRPIAGPAPAPAAAGGAASAPGAIKLPAAPTLPAPAAREVFAEMQNRRIAETQRSGAPLSVLCFRISQLAELEKQYGREASKVVFQWLGAFLRRSLRDMDLLGYANAGEVAAMIPGSSESAARIVGQRIATAISSFPIPIGQGLIHLDVEFGAASAGAADRATSVLGRARDEMDAAARSAPRAGLRQATASAAAKDNDGGAGCLTA